MYSEFCLMTVAAVVSSKEDHFVTNCNHARITHN
jgi:hypothetical protein